MIGLCARHPYDPAMWDDDVAGESAEQKRQRQRMAAEVCRRCPLVLPCRTGAREGREEGVWGGRVLRGITVHDVRQAVAA